MNSVFPYGGTVSGVQFRAPEDDIKSLVIFSNLKSRSKECPTFGIMHETLDEEQKFGPPVLKKLAVILTSHIFKPKSNEKLNKLLIKLNLPQIITTLALQR